MSTPDQPVDDDTATDDETQAEGSSAELPSAREVLGTDLPSSGAERNDQTEGDEEIMSPR